MDIHNIYMCSCVCIYSLATGNVTPPCRRWRHLSIMLLKSVCVCILKGLEVDFEGFFEMFWVCDCSDVWWDCVLLVCGRRVSRGSIGDGVWVEYREIT